MTRIPAIKSREDVAPEGRTIFDEISSSRGGRVSGPFTVLLHSPEIARRVAHTGAYIRFESTISDYVNELAVITVTREVDCQYAYSAHEPQARTAGVREEAITAVRERRAPEGLNAEEAVVVTYVLELLRDHRVSEPTFTAALDKFGLQALTDLTATVGYYGMLACALNAFEVESETPLLPV